jgi:glycosyltransferase involved in cell wall biosynthesis
MKILVHDFPGYAFPVQLSRALAQRGHQVLHLYAGFSQSPHGFLLSKPEDSDNFKIEGLFIRGSFKKYSFLKRWKQEKEYGKCLIKRVLKFSPDIILSGNTSLDIQAILVKYCRQNKIKLLFWLQDICGLAIFEIFRKRIPLIGFVIGRYYMHLEKKLLQRSSQIIAISEDFRELLIKWRIDPKKISVIPNWSVIDEIWQLPKKNYWSDENQLADKTCLIYSGTLGLKHNPEMLLELATFFKYRNDVRIVVISEGLGADWLKKKKMELCVDNLIILNYQPYEDLSAILATAEILIAILNLDAGIYSVPSKVLTYLCVGRPLLLAVPEDNLSARIVLNSKSGVVVSPNDTRKFAMAAKMLIEDKDLRSEMGKAGRKYAEEMFNIQRIADCFEEKF